MIDTRRVLGRPPETGAGPRALGPPGGLGVSAPPVMASAAAMLAAAEAAETAERTLLLRLPVSAARRLCRRPPHTSQPK